MNMLVDGEWRTDMFQATNEEGLSSGRRPRSGTGLLAPTCRSTLRPNRTTASRLRPVATTLYVSYACPWAHRTLLIRALMGLEDAIDISVVDPYRDDDGWQFTPRRRGVPRTNSTGATISVNCTSRPTPTPPAG